MRGPPDTAYLTAVAAESKQDQDSLYGNAQHLAALNDYVQRNHNATIQPWSAIPIHYLPSVLGRFNFHRKDFPQATYFRQAQGYPEFSVGPDWVLRGRLGMGVIPAMQYSFPHPESYKCPNAASFCVPTLFSGPSFRRNIVGSCGFCKQRGEADACPARDWPIVVDVSELSAQDKQLWQEAKIYEDYLQCHSLESGKKRGPSDNDVPPPEKKSSTSRSQPRNQPKPVSPSKATLPAPPVPASEPMNQPSTRPQPRTTPTSTSSDTDTDESDAMAAHNTVWEQYRKQRDKVRELETKVIKLKGEKDKQRGDFDVLRERADFRQDQLDQSQIKITSLSVALEEAEKNASRASTRAVSAEGNANREKVLKAVLQERFDRTLVERNNWRQKCDNQRKELNQLQETHTRERFNHIQVVHERDQLKAELRNLRAARAKIDEPKDTKPELEVANSENDRLAAQIKKLSGANEALKWEKEKAEQDAEMRRKMADAASAKADAEAQLSAVYRAQVQQQDIEISKLRAELRKSGSSSTKPGLGADAETGVIVDDDEVKSED